MQVEDTLHLYHHSLEIIEVSKKTRKPDERYGLVKEEAKSHVANLSFILDADSDGNNLNDLARPSHAQVKPNPAAVMADSLPRFHINHSILTSFSVLFLAKGANDGRSSDRFLHQRTPWCRNDLKNLMQLIVRIKVRLRELEHYHNHYCEGGYHKDASDLDQ